MEDISIRYWTRDEGSWKKEPRRVQCERRKLLKSNIIIVFSFAAVWQVPWWTFWFQGCSTSLVGSSFPSLVLIVVVFLTWPRKTMPATIEEKWGSIRRKASKEQPQGCLVVKGWSLFIGARSQRKTNHDRVCSKSGQDGRRRKHVRFSILVEEYPRRNPKWEAGNLRRQDQRRKWQVLESRQCSMRDDRCFRLLTIQR